MDDIKTYTHPGTKVYRVISTRYPTIHLFEDVASEEEFDALYALESLTNDRLREQTGNLDLVPRDQRVYGEGFAHIMSSFTHVHPSGGRFNTGQFGAYYCADAEKTAIMEVKFHRERFFKESRIDVGTYSEERILTNRIHNNPLHTIIDQQDAVPELYLSDNYSHSQTLAIQLKSQDSWGISYNSVRDPEGICHALFKPKAVTACNESKKLRMYWNGHCIHYIEEIKLYKV